MKSTKLKFYAILLWGMVVYAIVLLTYCTYRGIYSDSAEAISAYGSILGASGTFFTAIVAAYFVHDWKNQHNLQILANEAKEAFHLYYNQRDIIHNFRYQIESLINNNYLPHTSEHSIALDFQQKFIIVYNNDKEKLSAFCYLSEGQDLYNITIQYGEKIQEVEKILAKKANSSFSTTTFLNLSSSPEFLQIFQSLEDLNQKVLQKLKSYIFFN